MRRTTYCRTTGMHPSTFCPLSATNKANDVRHVWMQNICLRDPLAFCLLRRLYPARPSPPRPAPARPGPPRPGPPRPAWARPARFVPLPFHHLHGDQDRSDGGFEVSLNPLRLRCRIAANPKVVAIAENHRRLAIQAPAVSTKIRYT